MDLIEQIESIVAEVRVELAPDPRLAVYELAVMEDADTVVLVGVTSEPAAAEALHRRIALLGGERLVRDEIRRLPYLEDGAATHALVRASVAPMLAGPLVSESHVSQTVLGHRLTVLREHGRWLQCRSPDGYLGWIHRGYLHRVSDVQARRWEAGADGEVRVSLGARVLDEAGEVLVRLPWGARVVGIDGTRARLPDGLLGHLQGETVPEAELARLFPPAGDAVVETAGRWVGAPYVWGGVTPAGVDCSGLVQTVYRTHGVGLPRDSDLQARAGVAVEPGRDFGALRSGDLLFFAEDAARISHVAISLGGTRVIHSSLGNGGVRRNDLAGDLPYEEELRRLFVCARRVLGE